MGARQSKRSVDISGTPKKGETENGTVTGTEEKLEKISEGDTIAKVNANGSTTTTSTVTAEQQESVSATPAALTETMTTMTTTITENATVALSKVENVLVEVKEKASEIATIATSLASSLPTAPSDDSKQEPSSPTSPTEEEQSTEEGGGSSKKKKKNRTKWSFRSWSFSKKDRVKPPMTKDEKQQETVPEDNENAAQLTEQANPEATNTKSVQNEEPPPLPSSPPPTPAEEVAVTEKEETPTISEGDVDASGGGEGLAEPIEDAELEVSTPAIPACVEQSLTNGVSEMNGNAKINGKLGEDEPASPVCERQTSADSVTAKIGSLKLQIVADNADVPSQNGVDEADPIEMNGMAEKMDSALEKAIVEN